MPPPALHKPKNDPWMLRQHELFKGPPEKVEDLPGHLNEIERIFGKSKVKASTMVDGYEVTSADTMETLLAKQEYVRENGPQGMIITP